MRTKTKHNPTGQQEPLGIVIADGGQGEAPSRFSAFVWGPVPEDLELLEQQDQLATAAA